VADFIDLMAKNKPREAGKSFADTLKRQRMNELMTHGENKYQAFMPAPVGNYLDKVISGGYLRENVDRWNAAMDNSKAQAFEGAPDNGLGSIMDYFAPMAMTAYHGSPHLFDKFSLDNIGTGEGAQAYGHGLYFAENPKVAGQYQSGLSGGDVYTFKGKEIQKDPYNANASIDKIKQEFPEESSTILKAIQNNGDIDKAIAQEKALLKSLNKQGRHENDSYIKGSITQLENIKGLLKVGNNKGHLYEVDIPDEHVKNFLDWDAPIGEQKHIVDAIKPSKNDLEWYRISKRMNDIASDPKGGHGS
jgi:hypothetical protein